MAAKKSREKKYRKIKRTHLWGTLVEFVIFAAGFAVLMALGIRNIGLYIVDTKIAAEYDKIAYMARLYDNGFADRDSKIYELLDDEGRDYIVINEKGTVVHRSGTNSCSDKGEEISLPGVDEKIMAYRDSKRGFIYPENGKLNLDFTKFREWASDDENEDETDLDGVISGEKAAIALPVWMSVKVADGNRNLICKAVFSIGKRDAEMFIGIIAAVGVLTAVILFTMLFAAVKNFVRQHNMVKLFFTDVVTEGHNQTFLLIKGEKLLRKYSSSKNRFAVISLRFNNYNNLCLCHSAAEGETVLRKIYGKINGKLERKEMCAHLGAATFGLILRYRDGDELRQRLAGMIGELEVLDADHKFYFRAGVALTDKEVDDSGVPIRAKDLDFDTEFSHATAARLSLGGGEDSGIAFFDEKLMDEQKWADHVQERQQAAIDNEEFVVYYQPKYNPESNELRGAEALIRWESPEMGFVAPGRFIPIFENNGFITEIDHYMLEHVAMDQKRWLDKGLKCVPVSVNVSRAHFIENDLAEQIRDIVDGAGTPHEYIEIELTESAFFDDKNAMLATIDRLKGYGFAVSMDDFGSGYSSLNSLKDMPLDVLKLDAEFFRGEFGGKRAKVVVSEAISLAKKLNMRIVAEGVEDKDQVDFLASEGCDMIQGYYYAKPMPKEDYEQRMQ